MFDGMTEPLERYRTYIYDSSAAQTAKVKQLSRVGEGVLVHSKAFLWSDYCDKEEGWVNMSVCHFCGWRREGRKEDRHARVRGQNKPKKGSM